MRAIWGLLLVGCAHSGEPASGPGSAPGPTSSSAPSSTSVAAPGVAPTGAAGLANGSPPTGGSVSLGEVVAPKNFDPNPVLVEMRPKLLACFNEARAGNPTLRGKLRLKVQVKDPGVVTGVDADPGDPAYDPQLVVCLGDAFKTETFPPPGGLATITVPVVFRR